MNPAMGGGACDDDGGPRLGAVSARPLDISTAPLADVHCSCDELSSDDAVLLVFVCAACAWVASARDGNKRLRVSPVCGVAACNDGASTVTGGPTAPTAAAWGWQRRRASISSWQSCSRSSSHCTRWFSVWVFSDAIRNPSFISPTILYCASICSCNLAASPHRRVLSAISSPSFCSACSCRVHACFMATSMSVQRCWCASICCLAKPRESLSSLF